MVGSSVLLHHLLSPSEHLGLLIDYIINHMGCGYSFSGCPLKSPQEKFTPLIPQENKQTNKTVVKRQNIDRFWSHGFNMHMMGMPKAQGGPPIRNIAYFAFKFIIEMIIFTSC